LSALFRQDRTDGRQRGRVQLELFDGRAECKGFERGRCDSAAVGDASYIDVTLIVNIVCFVKHLLLLFPIVSPHFGGLGLSPSLSVSGIFVGMLAWQQDSSSSNRSARFDFVRL
jgi:hypothetical protein